jgi:hypothetical protein
VTLRRSKTDQAEVRRKIGIPYGSNPETGPVRVLQAWIELAGITSGPLFRLINRHGQVPPIGRDRCGTSGEETGRTRRPGGRQVCGPQSPGRACDSAAIAGASERSIMNQTGHRSVQMVRRYIRDGSLFRENSAAKLGCRS